MGCAFQVWAYVCISHVAKISLSRKDRRWRQTYTAHNTKKMKKHSYHCT